MEKNILFEKHEESKTKSSSKDVAQIPQTMGSFGTPIQLRWPTDYLVITQNFGANPELRTNSTFPGHEGLDIRAPRYAKVYSCADGVVETIHSRANDDHPYGRFIVIQHKDGYWTTYGHLSNIVVTKGQRIKSGTQIGNAGNTGQTTGGHIHLGLTKQGTTAKGLTHFPGDIIDPTPFLSHVLPQHDFSFYPWPFGYCLPGLQSTELSVMNASVAPEAGLLDMNAEKDFIRNLRKEKPNFFLMGQLHLPKTSKPLVADEWATWVKPSVQRLLEAGVGYFSVLKTPNVIGQGNGLHWNSGKEFSRWWLEAVTLLKTNFPTAKFGFPGLSAGDQVTGQRLDARDFMEAADDAMLQADWLGVICKWSSPQEMLDEEKGRFYVQIRRYYPEQFLFITEFNNVNQSIDKSARAKEISQYFDLVKDEPGIGAAFAGS